MLGKKMFGRKSDFIFILLMIILLFCSLSVFPGEGEAVEQWRVVLKWTGQPHDLDAHLLVPQASPNDLAPFHLSWEQTGSIQAYPYAVLENDSIQEGGSETIVIGRLLAGTYKFAVQNFSMEKALAGSQAVVEVFRGSERLAVYQLEQAAGGKGRWWHVFKIQDGELV
ncbi:MAG: hypothetical protein K6U04_11615, partial [Armatimonadetes bacterium]|nr:hypothetical protein [Armatimonadota bacterium]